MRPSSAAWIVAWLCLTFTGGCGGTTASPAVGPAAAAPPAPAEPVEIPPAGMNDNREIRLSGIVEAVHSSRITVPQLLGQNNRMTLVSLVANGAHVEQGDVIAEFDALEQIDAARTARAKLEDLDQQVRQKVAQNRADSEKRRSDLQQAEATYRKAQLELSKAEILPEIEKQQNNIRARIAAEHLTSLQVSLGHRDRAEAAALHTLELQRERQQVALERAQINMENLKLRAPLSGMVAHTVLYRNGSITHAQPGDQLYRGNGLVSIFDPSEMLVRCSVGEPDRAKLRPGAHAMVYLDAYPDVALPAHFESASPIATTALGSPIKTFAAIFKLDRVDPRLLPDLSAAVVLEPSAEQKGR